MNLTITLPRTEPDIVLDGRNLAIRQNEPFINWTILDKFIRSDMGLSDAADLRRAVVWLTDEVKIQARLVDTLRRQARDAESECDELRNATDTPIAEALKALGWTPPGSDE